MNLVSPMELQLHLHQQMLYRQQQITLHHHRPEEMPAPSGWFVPPSPGAGPSLPRDVKVELHNKELWQQFHAETTEMIITKLGRRMFPSVQLLVSGLDRRARYCLLLEVAPASPRRHKYVGGAGGVDGSGARGWTSAGPAEPQPRINRRVYLHPDSPASGAHWMQHPISFSKLKLTNNAVDHHNNVVLASMHKYIPKIWIIRCDDLNSMNNLSSQPAASFYFNETEFIAVTAYQNENITKLKIDNNPFAKGFRETGQSRCKRKLHHLTSEDSNTGCEVRSPLDDEEGNVSSSESESNRTSSSHDGQIVEQRTKRALSEAGSLDDSGVSSSDGASPPLPSVNFHPSPTVENNQNPRPRLHRPWADSPPPPLPKPAPAHQQFPLFNPFLMPQHHFAALELARIQQIHRYYPGPLMTKFYH
ncbi:T-box transcription factor TBX6-like [Orussus abietinus]|uniref:T-box transcription factor TBX6-like n=1 Tax=Orussus abietinus TaxID=222816 RepID=UPI0006257488|nr:T-box transcription factor TBX6-like [Orussus abietinus]